MPTVMSKTKLKDIKEQIDFHYAEIEKLGNQRKKQKGLSFLTCKHCKKRTRINKLNYIETYWYEEPYSCMAGDTWHYGHINIPCPKCDKINSFYEKTYKRDENRKRIRCEKYAKWSGLKELFMERWKQRFRNEIGEKPEKDVGQMIW